MCWKETMKRKTSMSGPEWYSRSALLAMYRPPHEEVDTLGRSRGTSYVLPW